MARRESPLDPSEGPLQSFAHNLRTLREKKGLTYRELAAKAGYSRTTLADAAKGKDLPTVDVVRAYVGACDGDEEEWVRRWREVNALLSAQQASARRAHTSNGPGTKDRYPDRALRDLAEEVRRLWVHEGLEVIPTHVLHVELGLAEQRDAVRDSYGGGVPPGLGKPEPLPAGTRLVDLFGKRFNRRCLVLGAAGAGKTTVLLELARDLLARAEGSGDAPVPVVLLLSRWTDRPAGGLAAWIVEEMAEHYKVDADRTRAWLEGGQLTLLLDGLDEVHLARRAACVQAINRFRRDGRCSLTGLVVSSRTADYVDLDTRLELGGAVTLQPVTQKQIDERLARAGARLSGLRAAVANDPVLAELLATPLMLSVAVLAYQGRHSDPALERGSTEHRRQCIFDQYVGRMLTRDRALRTAEASTTAGNRFTPQTTHRGLVWLARLMNRRGETIFYPDWFTPAWLPNCALAGSARPRRLIDRLASRVGWQRLAVALTYGVAGGVIIGTAYSLHALLANGVESDTVLNVSPGYGLLIGGAVCLAITASVALTQASTDRATARRYRSWGRLLRISFCGSVFILAGGIFHGVLVWQRHGHRLAEGVNAAATYGLAFGLSGATSVLLALVLARWLVRIDSAQPDARWQWSWHRMEQGMFTGIVISPAVGLAHALAYALTHSSALPFVHGLLFGLGQGLIIGLSAGLAIGLTFALVDIDTDRPAAQWRWSPRRLGAAVLAAAVYGLTYWLLIVAAQAVVGPASGAVYGLFVGLIFWVTFALGHGLIPDRTLPPPAPARALSASLRAATPPTIVTTSLGALTVTITAHLTSANLTEALRLNLVTPTVLAGTLTFWFTGGGVWLAHHAARWAASKAGLLPRDILGFLAHADERLLLRRAGGGYQFLHRTLQEHIANRDADAQINVHDREP
jgi:transcriptional regulator with XRE-family HTH domain